MTAPSNESGDGALLDRFQAGDTEAFTALVVRHERPLLLTAKLLLGPGLASRLAEDVVQDTFLKLARTPPVLPDEVRGDAQRERAQLAAWLNRVARNRAMEMMRSESRRTARERIAGPREAVGGEHERADVREAVLDGLHALPEDQRETLVLRLFHGLSYREIADATGRKIGTVGWLISEGVKALGQRLAPAFDAAARGTVAPHDDSLRGGSR